MQIDCNQFENRNPIRFRGMRSLSASLLLVAVAAVALAGYLHWKKHHTRMNVVYPVAGLYVKEGRGFVDPQPLIQEITSRIQPKEWAGAGGMGTIQFFYLSRSLIVRTNVAAHEEIKRLLDRKLIAMKRVD